MYRKLEKETAKSVRPEVIRSHVCQCNCSGFGQKGEQVMPAETSLKNQVGVYFVVKG